MNCSDSCYILALILLDRLRKLHPHYSLTPRNVHKLLFTAIIVAVKSNDDHYYSEEYYAKVSGLKVGELCSLQFEFLRLIDYDTNVNPRTYEDYAEKLEEFHQSNRCRPVEDASTIESSSCEDQE